MKKSVIECYVINVKLNFVLVVLQNTHNIMRMEIITIEKIADFLINMIKRLSFIKTVLIVKKIIQNLEIHMSASHLNHFSSSFMLYLKINGKIYQVYWVFKFSNE